MTDAALLELAERDEQRQLTRLEREAARDSTPDATARLAASLRATIEAEPGQWSVRTLALDYDVSPSWVRRALDRVPHDRRGGRLWPRAS